MPACGYCDREFDDEERYHAHLRDAHAEELGPIDRRRAGLAGSDEGSGLSAAPVALGVVLVAVGAVVAYVLFFSGGGSPDGGGDVAAAKTPYAQDSVHYHGSIDVVIDGQRLDFSQGQYQLQADAFHFEEQKASPWHVHAKGVTLEYAMATLDIGVTRDAVTFEGTTYRDGDAGTNVTVAVNGQSVDPTTYVLQEDDQVTIRVETESGTGTSGAATG